MTEDLAQQPWSVESTGTEGGTRLTVSGELDAVTAVDIHNRIAETTDGDLELDLASVSFIDSSGLAVIIEGHLRLAAHDRRLVIVDRSPVVQRVFELSGVVSRLGLEPS